MSVGLRILAANGTEQMRFMSRQINKQTLGTHENNSVVICQLCEAKTTLELRAKPLFVRSKRTKTLIVMLTYMLLLLRCGASVLLLVLQ